MHSRFSLNQICTLHKSFFRQCDLKVSVRELAHLIHSRHAHACGTYLLGKTQVRYADILIFSRKEMQIFWSCENRKYLKVFSLNPIVQMLIVTGGYHVGHKLKSTEVVDCSSFSHHDLIWHCVIRYWTTLMGRRRLGGQSISWLFRSWPCSY